MAQIFIHVLRSHPPSPTKPFVCVQNSRFRLAGAIGQGHHLGLEVRGTDGVSARPGPRGGLLNGNVKKKMQVCEC